MRSLVTISLSLVAASACVVIDRRPLAPRAVSETVATHLPPITAEETPERCFASLARVNSPGLDDEIAGRIELARCVAGEALSPLELTDRPESAVVIDEMVGPAFVLLEEAMSRGDAAARIAALRTKAEIYRRMGARMIATVPPARDASFEAAYQHDRRVRAAERLTDRWHEHARLLHQEIVAIGDAHQEVLDDPAARLAISDAERMLAVPIATRE